VAKWTGDFFNKGIYDIHIHLKGVPLLEWETEVEMDKWDLLYYTCRSGFLLSRITETPRIWTFKAHLKISFHNIICQIIQVVEKNMLFCNAMMFVDDASKCFWRHFIQSFIHCTHSMLKILLISWNSWIQSLLKIL